MAEGGPQIGPAFGLAQFSQPSVPAFVHGVDVTQDGKRKKGNRVPFASVFAVTVCCVHVV